MSSLLGWPLPLRRGGALARLGRSPARPPRVAHLCESLEAGAVASQIEVACVGLPGQGTPCFCVCLGAQGERSVARVPEQAVLELRLGRCSPARRAFGLGRALGQLRVDILHTHGGAYADGLRAALMARVPILLHSEVSAEGGASERALRAGDLLTARFLAGSRHAAAAMARRGRLAPDRIRLLPPVVDTDRFRAGPEREPARQRLGVAPGQLLIGSVGRLQPSRNYPGLLDAVALLCKEGADVRCLLVGDGLEADTLSYQARQLGIAERVHLTGFTREVPALLSAMDVFVLPSSSDHIPQSLLEAMATGLPIVVGSGGPIPEVIRDGESGLLVPADRPKILARILRQLGNNAGRRAALGERARRAAEQRHRKELLVLELQRLYGDLASRG